LALAFAVACGGGSQAPGESATRLIQLDGSSTVFPISEAVADEFQKANPNARVTIELCQKAGIEYIELPVAYDGLAVVVNPKNTWATSITVSELKTLWAPEAQGKVLRWNQVRPSWPNREIRLFGAGVDSGTYDYFTEAVVGKEGASRGDFTSSEDDNVLVQGVGSDELALGFIPYAYVEQNQGKLKLVPVDDGKPGDGEGAIAPSAETVRNGTYQPLSRPLFVYVARKAADRPEVQRFIEAYFDAQDLIREVGYVELTPEIYDLARKHFADRKVGTAFGEGGSQVGLTLEQLLTRER
jgi:phosphate transport system substrate-binding protein